MKSSYEAEEDERYRGDSWGRRNPASGYFLHLKILNYVYLEVYVDDVAMVINRAAPDFPKSGHDPGHFLGGKRWSEDQDRFAHLTEDSKIDSFIKL